MMDEPLSRAVVLAAGLGTRLRWLTREQPKALMDLGGEPVIAHVIRRLAAAGVHEVAVNAHHHAAMLAAALGDGARLGVCLHVSFERELLDSGGGVRKALALLPGGADGGPLLVHNADVVADIDLRALAARCPEGGCALALVANSAHHPGGDFLLDDDGRVRLPEGARAGQAWTFAGVSVWDAAVWRGYPAGKAFPLVEPIRDCIAAGRCAGLVHRGFWFDVGRPRDLFRARAALGGGAW